MFENLAARIYPRESVVLVSRSDQASRTGPNCGDP